MVTKYSWTIEEQLYFTSIINANNLNRYCDYFLINSTSKELELLKIAYSNDEILGLFWNFIWRRFSIADIEVVLDKLIKLEPRLLCLPVAMVFCRNYEAFMILVNHGYVPCKRFINDFTTMLKDFCYQSSDKANKKLVDKHYGKVIKYLVKNDYINYNQFVNNIIKHF
jgi:hypothetical protein